MNADPFMPFVVILAAISLITTIVTGFRRARFISTFDVDHQSRPPSDGLVFWFIGFACALVTPSLASLSFGLPWYFPTLFPEGSEYPWAAAPVPLFITFLAWIAAWLLGAPIAASYGIRVASAFAITLIAAGVIAGHTPLFPIVYVLAIVQSFRLVDRVSVHHVATSATCLSCGYDVSKTPNAPCPECGTPYLNATAIYNRSHAIRPGAMRIPLNWSIAAFVSMFTPPVGLLAAGTGYILRGIPLSSAVQLAQQYDSGSFLLLALPLPISASVAAIICGYTGNRRAWRLAWLLVPLGLAASFAMRWFV